MAESIILFQMQRMGDLVLTFPLILWLARRFPDHPLRVVAEPLFYRELAAISPDVEYLSHEQAQSLRRTRARTVINLSHRDEAAELAGSIDAERWIGPLIRKAGQRHIRGFWQMYRASIVHNNRHNRFHWADLNALDIVPRNIIRSTTWQLPQAAPGSEGRVGIFLGASTPVKRPTEAFWADLVRELLGRGYSPLLFGGPAETKLGRRVSTRLGMPSINLCGSFALPAFVRALTGLNLFITPDTGPMHLAAWMGVPTLNLSMGPVSPWETGPYQEGHYVLQANMSCTGCWTCTNPDRLACRKQFPASRVAALVHRIIRNDPSALTGMKLSGLRLFRTGRDAQGFYDLTRVDSGPAPAARETVDLFWKTWLTELSPPRSTDFPDSRQSWDALAQAYPGLALSCKKGIASMGRSLAAAVRRTGPSRTLPQDFWKSQPPMLRPLTSLLQLKLENQNYSDHILTKCLEIVELLVECMD